MNAPKRCVVSGCYAWSVPDTARCPQHQRPGWQRLPWYDGEWSALSKRFRKEHPVCMWPGCSAPSEETDHIIPIREAQHLRLEWSNLRALCKPHHADVTAAAQRKAMKRRRAS